MSGRVIDALCGVLVSNTEPKVCRCCGFNYVHITAVAVKQGEVITSIDRERVVTSPCLNNRRGSDVAIEYRCEDGCSFVETFSFHKGQVFEDCIDFGRTTEPYRDLWRD